MSAWAGGGRGLPLRGWPLSKTLIHHWKFTMGWKVHRQQNYSLINSVASWADGMIFQRAGSLCCLNCLGRRKLSGCAGSEEVCICLHVLLHTPFSFEPPLRYSCTFQPCIQLIQPRNPIGLPQGYLVVLIWAQKWHSCKTDFHNPFTIYMLTDYNHVLYLQIQCLNCYFSETKELYHFLSRYHTSEQKPSQVLLNSY